VVSLWAFGYEAARQLDLLMQCTPLAKKEITLPPVGITTRQSTDVFAVDDLFHLLRILIVRHYFDKIGGYAKNEHLVK
jgi:hypothetical protein